MCMCRSRERSHGVVESTPEGIKKKKKKRKGKGEERNRVYTANGIFYTFPSIYRLMESNPAIVGK